MKNEITTLTGHDAIAHAEATGATLRKYADPIEGSREGLTLEEAREIAAEDPGLVWTKRIRLPRLPHPHLKATEGVIRKLRADLVGADRAIVVTFDGTPEETD